MEVVRLLIETVHNSLVALRTRSEEQEEKAYYGSAASHIIIVLNDKTFDYLSDLLSSELLLYHFRYPCLSLYHNCTALMIFCHTT